MGSSSRMKKRKSGLQTARPRGTPWTHQEVLEVLAYLSYAAKWQQSPEEILRGLSQDIEQQFDRYRTPEQIQSKLRSLFRSHGHKDLSNNDFHLVYRLGSAVFNIINSLKDHLWVAKREVEIVEFKLEELRDSPRKLRGYSGTPASGRFDLTPVPQRNITARTQLRQESAISGSSNDTLRAESIIPNGCKPETCDGSPQTIKEEHGGESTNTTMELDQTPTITRHEDAMDFEYNDQETTQVPETPCYPNESPAQQSSHDAATATDTLDPHDCGQGQGEQIEGLQEENKSLKEELVELTSCAKKAQYFEAELQQSKADLAGLRADHASLQRYTNERLGPQELKILESLLLNDKRVAQLKQQLRELENLVLYEMDKLDLSSVDLREVEKQRSSLCYHLEGLFGGQDYTSSDVEIEIHPASDFEMLCQRVKLLDGPPSTLNDGSRKVLRIENVRLAARALVAAALCSWVFQVNLKDLLPGLGLGEQTAPPSLLLQKYKDTLAARGETFVRNLDMKAHEALFKDDLCQKFLLPDISRTLAQRVTTAILPLFQRAPSADSMTTMKLQEVTEADCDRLAEAFASAIQLRLLVFTGRNEFLCSLWGTGVSYRNGFMDLAQESVTPGKLPSEYKGEMIRFTLVPGLLRVKPHGSAFSYDGLACITEKPGKHTDCLTMARVYLRDTHL